MYKKPKEKKKYWWNPDSFSPFILHIIIHVTITNSQVSLPSAQDVSFYLFFISLSQPISVVRADCTCQGKWLAAG